MTRNDVYQMFVWAGQLAYLDALENATDRDVRKRVRMLELLLKRWKRGW